MSPKDTHRSFDTVSLDDRYELEDGRVFLSGIQALIRLMVEQKRRDSRDGLKTGTFVTGYPGSPLGGIDVALRGVKPLLEKYDIRHLPGQNEELAATSIMGTQMIEDHPHSTYDGVVSYWYGKGPGIDRAGDALKHGNFAGTSTHGAVVVLSGEDHEAKSSSVPYGQEFAFEHFGMPVLYPSSVSEFIEFGLHAAAMSRFSGCWVSLKLVGPLCDGGETVSVSPLAPAISVPELEIGGKAFKKKTDFTFFPVKNIATERALYDDRHAAVRAYARANHLDRITVRGKADKIGIVAAGKSYADTRQALEDLGFDEAGLKAAGIRLLKLGLLCPMDETIVREFAEGLDEVIVVEEKRDFIERQIGRILLDEGRAIRLVGKRDTDGSVLFPVEGGIETFRVQQILSKALTARGLIKLPKAAAPALQGFERAQTREVPSLAHRRPNFCSGCPHNIGTRLAEGQQAWGSPGCHIFAILMDEPTRRIEAVTQYGGEGLPWIGLEPFTDRKHIVQNVGDGSLFHSSYLNIRYAVAAGSRITFKILYNSAIANTGGQPPVAAKEIPKLVKLLKTEGAKSIVIVTKDKRKYRFAAMPLDTKVVEPPQMEAELKRLEAVDGVTVLIYDGQCANERRRRQKRGLQAKPVEFTVVNEEVCENCGHCGEAANCMSLQKIDTPFGEKTRIHQSSCNQDQTCLEGECPSFVTVRTDPGKAAKRPKPTRIDMDLPDPEVPGLTAPFSIYTPGLGGTGVITVNAVLAQAATLDGHHAISYDQTGAAQKWGAVLSSLIIAPQDDPRVVSNSIGPGRADLYLALDLMAAGDAKNLMRCTPDTTASVLNTSLLPSGDVIRNVRKKIPPEPMTAAIRTVTDPGRTVEIPARVAAEALFGDYVMTNMIAVGAAFQAGLLPISEAAVTRAVELNGVQIEKNMQAFRAGRLAVHDPAAFAQLIDKPPQLFSDRMPAMKAGRDKARQTLIDTIAQDLPLDGDPHAQVKDLIDDLIAYQNEAYARRFAKAVSQIGKAAQDAELTCKFARNLHKLMAYKDEYEVARLLSQQSFIENVQGAFEGHTQVYFNLQPPLLRTLGMKKKLRFNAAWARPLLSGLSRLRGLRGSALDPFARSAERRESRALIDWYIDLVKKALVHLAPDTRVTVLAIAELPEDIRGYEHIKQRYLSEVRTRADDLMAELTSDKSRRTPTAAE